jgi:hypothetical protein
MSLVHSGASASIPTEEPQMTVLASTDIDHDAVYSEVLETLETAVKIIGRNLCDELYGALLDSVQDYLKDNIRFNIAATLAVAERARRAEWERAEAAEKRARAFENFARDLGRLTTGDEWVAMGRKLYPDEAVTAFDRVIMQARALTTTPAADTQVGTSNASEPKNTPVHGPKRPYPPSKRNRLL